MCAADVRRALRSNVAADQAPPLAANPGGYSSDAHPPIALAAYLGKYQRPLSTMPSNTSCAGCALTMGILT